MSTETEDKILSELQALRQDFETLSNDVEQFNSKFSLYQQATQWVVQLAFTLIASATLTIIISTVLKK